MVASRVWFSPSNPISRPLLPQCAVQCMLHLQSQRVPAWPQDHPPEQKSLMLSQCGRHSRQCRLPVLCPRVQCRLLSALRPFFPRVFSPPSLRLYDSPSASPVTLHLQSTSTLSSSRLSLPPSPSHRQHSTNLVPFDFEPFALD